MVFVCNFFVALVCFSSHPAIFFIEAALSFFSIRVLVDLCCLLHCKTSLGFEDYAFLHVGIAFLCVLGSPVLVFINEVFFLFKLLGRLLRPIAPSIIMSSFGFWCLWWLSSLSFMEVTTVFCSSLVNSFRLSLLL